MIDEPVPGSSQRRQGHIVRRKLIRVDAGKLDVAIPQVPVDVVGQLRGERDEEQPETDGHDPDPQEIRSIQTPARPARKGGPRIGPEGREEEQQTREWRGHTRHPSKRSEGRAFDETGQNQDTMHESSSPVNQETTDDGVRDPRPPRGVAVLIPALNEEEALPGVLGAIPWDRIDCVVVADNGSTDGTAGVARAHGAVVVTEPRRGYGAACLAGLAHLAALPSPPEVVAFLDGDQSDDPSQLDRIVGPVLSGEADLVIGVRTSHGGGRRTVPLHARLGNGLVIGLAHLLFIADFSDLGPFRAVSVEALNAMCMDDRNWGWTLQMQVRAARLNMRVMEVEVVHRERAAGRSKVSGSLSGSVMAGAKMLYTLLRERLRRLPGTA